MAPPVDVSSSPTWLHDVTDRFPEIRRSPLSRHDLPVDWEAAFGPGSPAAAPGVVLGITDEGLYSVKTPSTRYSHTFQC